MAEAAADAIDARGLTRRFGGFVAVAGIDLRVRHGEVFGLLGANGAGKTTAIRMLCGLLPPTSGEIRVAAVDMRRNARAARARIGYVTQRFALYGDLTVRENLALQAGLYGLDGRSAHVRIAWALDRLGLAGFGEQRANAVPLGHQRRLAVAAALLHEPDVLFLDEPTSGLDALARAELWELVYELAERGAGVLVTTHYMDEALFCDRLALMHVGRVVASGTPDDLLANGVDAPMLDVAGPAVSECTSLLRSRAEVLEVIPQAGRLRVRLRPGTDAHATARALAGTPGFERLTRIAPVAPVLEDVVVGILERMDEAR